MSGTKWLFVCLFCLALWVFYMSIFSEEPPSPEPAQPAIVQSTEVQGQENKVPVIEHSVLRDWKPNNDFKGLGLEILVSEEATEAQLVELIKTLAAGRDHVNIRVYGSEQAYQEERSQTYGDAYQSGYFLFYIKNLTGDGPFNGFNEIRWMQQKGHLPHKLGEKLQF